MILTFNEFLNEGKQVGKLYHYTNLEAATNIVKTNTLICGEEEQTQTCVNSFTRDKNFHKGMTYLPQLRGKTVCFVVDGDKLSNKYKVVPYQFNPFYGEDEDSLSDWDRDDIEKWRERFDEKEERVVFDTNFVGIKNFSKYVLDIIPVKDVTQQQIEELKEKLKGL